MPLFRYTKRLLGFLTIIIIVNLWICEAPGAELPLLKAPIIYQGEYKQKNGSSYHVLLYLGREYDFILHERITLHNKKISSWEIIGRWHQIQDNAFIQLTNKNDFYRVINVGGRGNLYIGIHMPTGKQKTIILHKSEENIPEYTTTGILTTVDDKSLFFEDKISGITYKIANENIVKNFMQKQQEQMHVYVKINTTIGKNGYPILQIKDIKNNSNKISEQKNNQKYFIDTVVGNIWKIVQIKNSQPSNIYILSFSQNKGKKDGILEIFDGKQHIEGKYTLQEAKITLTVTNTDNKLKEVINKTKTWQLTGEILELWDTNNILAVLEKIR